MCGIVGAVGKQNITSILVDGLKRLEYRGYDSAGIAVLADNTHQIQAIRAVGKVSQLEQALQTQPIAGSTGIAHTRWATHGVPSERNAHPILSGQNLALVHNGIIENHDQLRQDLSRLGYQFYSDTDTEVIVHLLDHHLKSHDFLSAVRQTVKQLEGAYALAIIRQGEANRIIAVRDGSPLVIGLGQNQNYLASDSLALLTATQNFIYLDEGDIADIRTDEVKIYDRQGQAVERKVHTSKLNMQIIDRGSYRHFMLKEIFEQPQAIRETLADRISKKHVLTNAFGLEADKLFDTIENVQIAACGTSYHAGLTAKYWLESIAKISCQVEVASELRYREAVVKPHSLFIAISQSGETADTLAALRQAKHLGYQTTLAICNVPESSIVREADFVILTRAGAEIGVASTKAFTTQLVALLLLTLAIAQHKGHEGETLSSYIQQLSQLPQYIEKILSLDKAIETLSADFADKQHALYLGRGVLYPIALEGALKLKELSYIHAEAYPAGELKHGPLALVDKNMPVVAIAYHDGLLEKLKSNLNEVHARGGELYIFADESTPFTEGIHTHLLPLPHVPPLIAPIVYTIPLQLLSYHVAVIKGTDVDQPRNLAKSVTVE